MHYESFLKGLLKTFIKEGRKSGTQKKRRIQQARY
jgi:hypothetical protein